MCSKSSSKRSSCISYSNSFMVPSTISYIYSDGSNIISQSVDRSITDLSRKIVQSCDLPKLQVVQKDGLWFTLNNSQLDLCRRLEHDGKCTKVRVDVVPLSEVPRMVRTMMTVPKEKQEEPDSAEAQTTSSDASRTTPKGYERLEQIDGTEEKTQAADSEADESESESSDYSDSESECDWSDDDDSSSVGSTCSAASQSTDDERECLI